MEHEFVVLVFGGRKFRDRDFIFAKLDELHKRRRITKIIHGDAPGTDRLGGAWAKSRGVPVEAFPADWSDLNQSGCSPRQREDGTWYDATAGLRRNRKMRDQRPHLGMSFPGGRGTANMAKLLVKAGIEVIRNG